MFLGVDSKTCLPDTEWKNILVLKKNVENNSLLFLLNQQLEDHDMMTTFIIDFQTDLTLQVNYLCINDCHVELFGSNSYNTPKKVALRSTWYHLLIVKIDPQGRDVLFYRELHWHAMLIRY